jgi:hypothetical protein
MLKAYTGYSITAATGKLARYRIYLVGVKEFRWDKVGTVRAGHYNFFCGKGN